MARVRYREKLAMVYAAQNTGNNLSALEEFAPGMIMVKDGVVYLDLTNPPLRFIVNTTDWIIDDPYVGHMSVVTDAAFKSRFDPTPQA